VEVFKNNRFPIAGGGRGAENTNFISEREGVCFVESKKAAKNLPPSSLRKVKEKNNPPKY
jgi:hypothetical protein